MPSFDFVFGGFKQKSLDSNNKKLSEFLDCRAMCKNSPVTTFYANTKICSSRLTRKYPKEVGKLCKKVFEDD